MSVWAALGFMFLGGILVGVFDYRAWRMYQEGKSEGMELRGNRR